MSSVERVRIGRRRHHVLQSGIVGLLAFHGGLGLDDHAARWPHANVHSVPGRIPAASRTDFGKVTCPLTVTLVANSLSCNTLCRNGNTNGVPPSTPFCSPLNQLTAGDFRRRTAPAGRDAAENADGASR